MAVSQQPMTLESFLALPEEKPAQVRGQLIQSVLVVRGQDFARLTVATHSFINFGQCGARLNHAPAGDLFPAFIDG